jgi:aminoglycoside 6'-N-acetyltransferase
VASVDGRPCGLIQRYAIESYPEYLVELAPVLPVPPGALSIDYLIGEPDVRGRGVGSTMIAAFVAESWAAFPDANDVIVPVSAANTASWRALERAGFARVAEGELEPDNPRDSREHFIYRQARPQSVAV